MASSDIKMEGTKVISQVTLSLYFRPMTKLRLKVARYLLYLLNFVAPFEVTERESE